MKCNNSGEYEEKRFDRSFGVAYMHVHVCYNYSPQLTRIVIIDYIFSTTVPGTKAN